MSGAQQVTFMNQRSFGPPPFTVIGGPSGGGFWAGDISTTANSVATHHLVVAPVSSGQTNTLQWKNANTATPGADSNIDGPQNTADMVADGNSTVYPCAHFCNNAVIGGFSDWYMPAKNELDICYFNLKPTTQTNDTSSGINPNAVPARASNYTSGNPVQTSAAVFQTGGAEHFPSTFYWSSTELNATSVRCQAFYNGYQTTGAFTKIAQRFVRCVRRVPV